MGGAYSVSNGLLAQSCYSTPSLSCFGVVPHFKYRGIVRTLDKLTSCGIVIE